MSKQIFDENKQTNKNQKESKWGIFTIIPVYAPKNFQEVEWNCASTEGPAEDLSTSESTVMHLSGPSIW